MAVTLNMASLSVWHPQAGGSVVNGGMCDRLIAAERVVVNAALGGIVSEIGGGKFASGAMTGAYVMMFNELKHLGPTYRQLKKIYEMEKASIEAMSSQEFYKKLGGEIAQKASEYGWENACAARLCYAMNESGEYHNKMKTVETIIWKY